MNRLSLALLLVLLASPAAAQVDDATRARIDSIFSVLDRTYGPGCSVGVVEDGRLVFERGYGMGNLDHRIPLDGSSVFYLASVSKQFAAAAVLLAEHEGFLSRDDLVREHIPEFPDYGQPLTIRHLIHHTSGVRDYLTLMSLAGRPLENLLSDEEMLDLITRQKELNFDPGSEYLYSNSGYVLLSEVVHRATGRTLREYADEKIFRPLGMVDTHFHDDATHIVPRRVFSYGQDADGEWRTNYLMHFDKVGDGGLYSTVRDLARWDAAFYDDLLDMPDFAEAMYERGVLDSGDTISYAAGLTIGEWRGLPTVSHGGSLMAFRTSLQRFPEQRTTVIQLCNTSVGTGELRASLPQAVFPDAVAESDPDVAQEASAQEAASDEETPDFTPSPARLEALAGEYYSEELGVTWTVRRDGDELVASPQGVDRTIPLSTADGVTFTPPEPGRAIWFDLDEGVPTGFTLDVGRVRNLRFERVR